MSNRRVPFIGMINTACRSVGLAVLSYKRNIAGFRLVEGHVDKNVECMSEVQTQTVIAAVSKSNNESVKC